MSQQACVHAQHAQGPDLAVAAAFGTEQLVQAAVDVGDDGERNREVVAVSYQSFRRCEGNNDNSGVTELVEVVAHGDHVFLTRQSSKVSMEYQYQRASALIGGAPDLPGVIERSTPRLSARHSQGHVPRLGDQASQLSQRDSACASDVNRRHLASIEKVVHRASADGEEAWRLDAEEVADEHGLGVVGPVCLADHHFVISTLFSPFGFGDPVCWSVRADGRAGGLVS